MVDPNRKINRLTDKDIEFLEECEREFSLRYTEEDIEFMKHCSKPLAEPPIIDNWLMGGGGGTGGREGGGSDGGGGRNHHQHHRVGSWRGGGGNRGWRGGGGGFDGGNRNFRQRREGRSRPYGDRNTYESRGPSQQNQRREPPTNRPPMNVRRDYGNFVAASKD